MFRHLKRPETITDILPTLHPGTWFDFSDWTNQTHENLIILDESKTKPTKKFLEDELKKQQDEYDSAQYQRDRAVAYPSIQDQLDKIYHSGLTAWKADIKAVKDKYPKP